MTKRQIKLINIQGVVAAGTAVITLPPGPLYHKVVLKVSAAAKTGVQILNELRIKINGKTQRVHTYTELDDLNKFNGAIYAVQNSGGAGNSYFLTIHFSEPWRTMQMQREILAWATGDVSSFQIEADILAAAGAVTFEAWAEVENSFAADGKPSGMRLINKWYRTQLGVTGIKQPFLGIPISEHLQQISFFDANISEVEILLDGVQIRNLPKALNDAILVGAGMVPVAGRFDIVFDHDDVLSNALPLEIEQGGVLVKAKELAFNLTLSDGTARNIPVIYQKLGKAD